MYLVSHDLSGFLRFHFKYGFLVIRCEQARIRWVFVTRQCGTRGVLFRIYAVNLAVHDCARIGQLAVCSPAWAGRRCYDRHDRRTDGSAQSSPFPDVVLTARRLRLSLSFGKSIVPRPLVRGLDPAQPFGRLDLHGGWQRVGILECGCDSTLCGVIPTGRNNDPCTALATFVIAGLDPATHAATARGGLPDQVRQ